MYSIYVHASDPAYKFRREELASELFVGRGLPSKPVKLLSHSHSIPVRCLQSCNLAILELCRSGVQVGWGQLSIVDAERRLLAWALLDLKNSYFVILSEK